MATIGFQFNGLRCSGCMACVVACMDQNDLPGGGPSFRHVIRIERDEYSGPSIDFISISCHHCDDAPCITVCPTGAIYKRSEDGIVHLNENICIGCHSCLMVCPFGVPKFLDGKMAKCHFCTERVDRGLAPACVRICPTGALGIAPVEK